jgi:hypothetical protein
MGPSQIAIPPFEAYVIPEHILPSPSGYTPKVAKHIRFVCKWLIPFSVNLSFRDCSCRVNPGWDI